MHATRNYGTASTCNPLLPVALVSSAAAAFAKFTQIPIAPRRIWDNDGGDYRQRDYGTTGVACFMKIGPKLVFVLANNQRERAGRPKLPLSWPGRLLWAAVRCNYVVQLISTQREAVAQQGKAEDGGAEGEGASSVAYAYAETIYAIYCLRWHSMSPSQAKPGQASPGQLGPPVVHLPFGHLGIAGNLCKKLFDRFAIRRKNAKQTSGSGGQAMHQSSCQYANIYTHTYMHTHLHIVVVPPCRYRCTYIYVPCKVSA